MSKCLFLICLLFLGLVPVAEAQAPPAGRPVRRAGMDGLLFRPDHPAGPVPLVLVLGGSEGGLAPEVSEEARLIAQHGYAALQLAYFNAGDLPPSLQLIPVEYFMRAIAWAQAQPGIDPARIAILGTSVGGEAALLIAAHDPAVRAVVAAVPSGIVWQGLGLFGQRDPASSFSWGGRPLPDLPHRSAENTSFFDRYSAGLAALGQHREAIIPVEEIRGPILLICGGRDVIWPSCPMSRMVVEQLKAAHFAYPAGMLAFAEAGHAVFGPPRDREAPDYAALGALGGTPAANDAAREEDWPAFLTFLDRAFAAPARAVTLGLAAR